MTRLGLLGLVLVMGGCDTYNPACVGEHETAEVDEDLGGVSAELHAASRSATVRMVDADGVATMLEIETTAVGIVAVSRGNDCSDAFAYSTDIEVSARSADGRVALELDGTMSYDGYEGGVLMIRTEQPSLAAVDLPMRIGATDTVAAVVIDLSGADGGGEIDWVLTTGQHIRAASFDLPWVQ